MRSFVFVSCFVALAVARPEAGYSYNAPAQPAAPTYSQSAPTSYQQPASGSSYSDSSVVGASYSVGGESSYSGGEASYSGAQQSYSGAQQSYSGAQQSYSAPQQSYSAPQQSYSSGGSVAGFDTGSHFADTSANFNSGSSFGSGSGFGGAASGGATTVVQKHIYVHVPPPEPEQHGHHGGSNGGVVNQKHYKIIFIKAPSAPSYSPAQIAAQQAANSEKTIVYVLVKKPEENVDASGNAIASPAAVPSKPEVYFIKYKTQGGGSTGGQISGGSGHVGASHDAVSGVSFGHSSSHSIGQPSPVYGPAH